KQQYALGIRGGTPRNAYSFSLGDDNNDDFIFRNGYKRITLNANNTYSLSDRLSVEVGLNYVQSRNDNFSDLVYGREQYKSSYPLYPYAQLADEHGNASEVVKKYRASYVTDWEDAGLLEWGYRPLDDWRTGESNERVGEFLARASIRYKVSDPFDINVQYQHQRQTT